MMVQLLGVFAEFERSSIVERTIAGMERKAARGEWTGGSVPFGYRLDSERRFFVPGPSEAPVVPQVVAATPSGWRAPHACNMAYRTMPADPSRQAVQQPRGAEHPP